MKTFWTERPFRIDVDGLALCATLVDRLLTGDTQGVAQLRLAGTKFSKDFRDGSRFNSTLQELVQFGRACGQANDILSVFQGIRGGLEVHGDHGLDRLLQFGDLGFRNTLDIRELAIGGMSDLGR